MVSESIMNIRKRIILDLMLAPGDHALCVLRARIIDGMIKHYPKLEKWFAAILKVYA